MTKKDIASQIVLWIVAAGLPFAGWTAAGDDPYVEFTGTQSVDTGYYVTSNTAVAADFQLTDTTTDQQCVWSAGGNLGHRLYVTGDRKWGWSCHDNYSGIVNTGLSVDGDRVIATVDSCNKVVTLEKNGTVWYERRTAWANPIPANTTSDTSMKIGSRYAENKYYASMKLYGLKIYESGVLMRDYVPATRDGIVGLYDKVDGGFIYDARLPAQAAYELTFGGTPYTVNDAYLESIANSGLNARMVISDDIRAEVDFAYASTNDQQRVFGWNSRPSFYITGYNTFAFSIGPEGTPYHAITPDTNRHTAVLDYYGKTLEIRTGGASSWKRTFSEDITPEAGKPTPVALFANTENATYTGLKFKHPARVKIYSAKFYRAGVLVHDYRPCVKGDVPGMRDLVDGAFVCGENVEAFRAGGDVERIADDGYIELTGNNQESGAKKWIDTGYKPGPSTRLVFDYALADNYAGKVGSGEWWYLSDYTPPSGDLPAERLNFAGNNSNTFRWRTGSDDFTVANSEVGAPTTQRGIRRRIVFDAAAKTYSLVTADYTNFTVTATTSISRTFERSIRLGGNTDFPPKSYSPLRIYGLKIYDGDTLVHDFQPKVVNGVPGLWDAQTGNFNVNAEETTKPLLGCGGTIAADAESKDAFLEFTGAQSIDTGIYPTANTAVVADFQLTITTNVPQQFVWSSNEMCQRLYTSITPSKFAWFCHNSNGSGVFSDIPVDVFRLTATLDGYNHVASLVRDGTTLYNFTGTWQANGNTCTSTMRIGSRFAEGSAGWNFTSMKLYSFKVYEAGALVRDYVPLIQGGVAGLYDRVNGTFVTDVIGTAPMKVGGIGSAITPLADTSVGHGKTKVLDAKTSGAVGYQWYMNGSAIEGATNVICTVAWRKGDPDAVSVVPYFDVFGVRTAGTPMSASVSYAPDGVTIIFR